MTTWSLFSQAAFWTGVGSSTRLLLASLWPSLVCSILLSALAFEICRHTQVRLFIASMFRGVWNGMLTDLKQHVRFASNHIRQSLAHLHKSRIIRSGIRTSFVLMMAFLLFAGGALSEHKRLSSPVGEWNCFFLQPRPVGSYAFSGLFAGQWMNIDVCDDYVAPADLRRSGMVLIHRMRFTDHGDCVSLNPKLGNWYKIAKQEDCRYVRLAEQR